MKLKVTAFWLVVLAALFIFLQEYSKFHFFFIEQSQLFQFTGEYISEKLAMPGGFALYTTTDKANKHATDPASP